MVRASLTSMFRLTWCFSCFLVALRDSHIHITMRVKVTAKASTPMHQKVILSEADASFKASIESCSC